MAPRKKPTEAAGAAKPRRTRKAPDAGEAAPPPARPRARTGKSLVIVESPAKAKTIQKYLGGDFEVRASYGHIRDLPSKKKKDEELAGVDIAGGWKPTYVLIERKNEGGRVRGKDAKEIVAELRREAAKADTVYLATDPDREGEAIAWHIAEVLGLDDSNSYRITFNEITRTAVNNALAAATHVNMNRVRAQEARRILDRAVGYPLSGLLGKKVARGSSAGRVQSVALKLIVDREREIEAFKTEEYWRLTALLSPTGTVTLPRKPLEVVRMSKDAKDAKDAPDEMDAPAEGEKPKKPRVAAPALPAGTYQAELIEWAGKKFEVGNPAGSNEANALAVARLLDTADYAVSKITQETRPERPQPPFITSTLQQQASIRLHLPGERTMRIAQDLYEGMDLGGEGRVALITYMRTDSTRISNDALTAVRGHIDANYGAAYLPEKANVYSSGKSAQEAHEAIRPTDVNMTPARVAAYMDQAHLRVYTMIWNRFVASQMTPARFAYTTVDIRATPRGGAGGGKAEGPPPEVAETRAAEAVGLFRAKGKIQLFDGYRKVMAPAGKSEDVELPALAEGQKQDRHALTASQHTTKPPPRYNEASLIKALEKEGIGRPSTYAPIIGKIKSAERGYVEERERRFYATSLGKIVTDLLVESFPDIMNLKFTSHFEEELDDIETGKMGYTDVLTEFWGPFAARLKEAEVKMPSKRGEETGEMCPKCGKPLVKNFSKKLGREFIGCSGFKDAESPCKYIKPREGEAEREEPKVTEHKCPACGKFMLLKTGRKGQFLSCSGYPECKTTANLTDDNKMQVTAQPTAYKCEKCGEAMVIRQGKRGPFLACTGYPKCKNAKDVDDQGKPVEPPKIDIKCEKCGKPMAVKKSFRGPFLGCTGYPACRGTRQMTDELRAELNLPKPPPKKAAPEVEIRVACPKCSGPMKLRSGTKGWFLGCASYPKCKGTAEPPASVLEQVEAAAT